MIYSYLRQHPVSGTLFAAVVSWIGATTPVYCQTCPTEVETEGNSTIIIGPTLSVSSCPMFDQGYMRLGDTIQIDARAELSGHCKYQVLSGVPPECTVINGNGQGEFRTVNNIAVKYYRPGSTFEYSLGTINGKNPDTGTTPYYMPTLDSTNPTNSTGPKMYQMALFGEYSFNVQAFVNTTMCNIGPNLSSKPSKTVYAVDCVPVFKQHEDSPYRVVRLPENPTTPFKIFPPSGPLTTAAEAARDTLNKILAEQGINVQFAVGSCQISDHAYCIRVQEQFAGGSCAQTQWTGDPVTGDVNSSPLMSIPDDSWDQPYLNYLVVHELTHLLGLDEPDCPRHKTVLWGGLCGAIPNETPAPATGPTPSDLLPIKKTSYGNASVLTCPLY